MIRSRSLVLRVAMHFCTLLALAQLLSFNIDAQTGTSTVRGSVADAQGNVIANVTVTLVSTETNATRTQTSSEDGNFVFDLIPPGTYRVEAEAQGFKKAVLTEVKALVARPTELSVVLEVGSVVETVTVSSGSAEALINTQDATIGNNFESRQITQLPLESRNVVGLLSLQPGVTRDGYVAGSRADQANITLDGVDVNEQQSGLDPSSDTDEAFSSVLRVTPDSIQEFRVTTTNPNAAQGRSSGGQVSLITRSGTNDFRGSLYWSHRNTVTTANDFFNNRSGIERPTLLRNLFGGSLGGPVVKNRVFFFYNYEGRRDASQASVVRVVPLANLGRGEVNFLGSAPGDPEGTRRLITLTAADINSVYPDVGVNPAGLAVLADAANRYPANDSSQGDGFNTGGYRFNAPTPLDWNTHIARFDINLTEDASHILLFRGNYQQDVIGRIPQFPDTPAPNFWNHPYGFVVGHTWTISPTLINNFRYGMTREAYTDQGDSADNLITFRFVYEPRRFLRTLSRTTPVHNFVDDLSWTRGNHSLQFGTNLRFIRNKRTDFGNSYDSAVVNPSWYDFSGAVLSSPLIDAGYTVAGSSTPLRNAMASVIGRLSQYTGQFNYDLGGNILATGEGVAREFATEEYDVYGQDIWKVRPNVTLTFGLRYGLSRPVYETNGLQVKPTTSLNDFFAKRIEGAAAGVPYNELITYDVAGPKNNRPGFYELDKNNFQPRVAFAYSPKFEGGFGRKLFGAEGDSVFRGGFSITNDYFGQQLAVSFDALNPLGFSSAQTIGANTYNVTDRPAPLFTGFNQDIRSLPDIETPSGLSFPLTFPADESQRIESALDDSIVSPIHYSWNASYGRRLPGGIFIEASYIGRRARNLFASRDVMALNNLVDPKSKVDWYTAAGQLDDFRSRSTEISAVTPIPYFENLFPGLGSALLEDPSLSATQAAYTLVAREGVGGFDILDWTYVQSLLDDLSSVGPNAFFHPQVAALSVFSTVAYSDYHAGALTIRQRLGNTLTYDFNYTLSKSMDNASGLQNSGSYGTSFILNPLRPNDNRSVSDFDVRHIVNANLIYELPIGRGRHFFRDLPGYAQQIFGGWQISNVFRWNSGLPVQTPFDAAQWATNWNVQSNGVRIRPLQSSPTRGGTNAPNLFSDPVAAYQSFRNARPGETGDRNVLRNPGYVSLDMGLFKSFTMPWSENHNLQFRWEVFNLTNTQRMGELLNDRTGLGLGIDPNITEPASVFGNYIGIQGSPRSMQFGFRYTF